MYINKIQLHIFFKNDTPDKIFEQANGDRQLLKLVVGQTQCDNVFRFTVVAHQIAGYGSVVQIGLREIDLDRCVAGKTERKNIIKPWIWLDKFENKNLKWHVCGTKINIFDKKIHKKLQVNQPLKV